MRLPIFAGMLTKTKGIVFRKVKYGETSLIVDVFTEEHGLMSYIISGVRQAKVRTGSALMQLMAIVDIVAYHSEKSKLHRIREAHPVYLYQNIPGDVRKNAIILFMAELCSKVIRQTEKHPALYTMIARSLVSLDTAQDHFADAHILFMIRLADHLGFGPEEPESEVDETGKAAGSRMQVFDLMEGRFLPAPPHHQYYMTDAALFETYLTAARNGALHVKTDRMSRNRVLDAMILYFQLHLDKMQEMHAHKVLREIL